MSTTLEQPIIVKYRPVSFDEVIGNAEMIGALRRTMASSSPPKSFLLTGPSGIGKTTLARIIGAALEADVTEIDAASNNGVDAMRELSEMGNYASMHGNGKRLFIIDECHMLSRPAWNALLKILEEPPPHLYFALCTTEFAKVIETARQRCFHVNLRAVKPQEMEELLTLVCEVEQWTPSSEVISAVVQAATGQPRKGLSLLQAVHRAPSREEVFRIIALTEASEPMIDLLKELLGFRDADNTWPRVQALLVKLDDEDWDQQIIGACRYIMAVMTNAKSPVSANRAHSLLECMTYPVSTFDRKAAFYVAVGNILWAQ